MNNYTSIKLKYVASLYTGNSISDSEKNSYLNKEIPYIPTKEVSLVDNTINYTNGLSVNKDDGFKIAPKGSTLLCIEGGSAGKKIAQTDRDVAFVNKLCCINSKYHQRYMFYALQSTDFTEQFNLNLGGLIGGVSISNLSNLLISFPDIVTQSLIAKVLDEKTKAINRLILIQEDQINKLNQYKNSLIIDTVFKGIHNEELFNHTTEWFGSCPKSWKISNIYSEFRIRNTKVSDKDYMPLSVTKLPEGILPQMDKVAKSDAHDDRKLVLKGDFVINSRSDRKMSCGVSKYDGSVSLINIVLQPIGEVTPNYCHYLLKNQLFAEEFYRWGHGIVADLWTTNADDLKRIAIPVPSKKEQIEIVNYLNSKCSGIDKLIQIKKEKIEKLIEYKKSLIYEYVTGKREVKEG